jgi:hypothetical protein
MFAMINGTAEVKATDIGSLLDAGDGCSRLKCR